MKRLALCFLLLVSLWGTAAAEGVVRQTSCSIMRAEDSWLICCFAQVTNEGDEVICLEDGTFDIYSGDALLASGFVGQMTPYFLAPGESGYLSDTVLIEGEAGMESQPVVTGLSYSNHYMAVDAAYASTGLPVELLRMEKEDGGLAVDLLIDNPTDATAWSPTIGFGLYSEGGTLLYADGRTLDNIGIAAGESVQVRFNIAGIFVERWESYGAAPAQARGAAAYGGDAD